MIMLSLSNRIDIVCNSLSLLDNGNLVDILTLINQGGVDIPTLITSLLNDTTFMNGISQANTGYTTAEADALFYSQTFLNTQLNAKINASVINNYMLSTGIIYPVTIIQVLYQMGDIIYNRKYIQKLKPIIY